MDKLQEKVMEAFIGKVVRKDLAFQVKGGLPVPTYVLEYLLGNIAPAIMK
jgi:ATP-dependent Lon protease